MVTIGVVGVDELIVASTHRGPVMRLIWARRATANERREYWKNRDLTYDPKKPPQLTTEERVRLAEARNEDVDTSDLPEQAGIRQWRRPGLAELANGERLLVVEENVVKSFQETGHEASVQMNAVLREYVEAQAARCLERGEGAKGRQDEDCRLFPCTEDVLSLAG